MAGMKIFNIQHGHKVRVRPAAARIAPTPAPTRDAASRGGVTVLEGPTEDRVTLGPPDGAPTELLPLGAPVSDPEPPDPRLAQAELRRVVAAELSSPKQPLVIQVVTALPACWVPQAQSSTSL